MCDDSFSNVNAHIVAYRYLSRMTKELKLPPEKDVFEKLLLPISELAQGGKNIWGSVVYLDKRKYTGPYLKPGTKRAPDPIKFRNRVLRSLLEHHFSLCPLQSQHYDLVLDRIEMTKDQYDNLQNYLAGNYNIPTPTNITHASSIYVEGLQIVHHMATGFKDVVAGGCVPNGLGFVNSRDISLNQNIT